jgi:hypothetical protein
VLCAPRFGAERDGRRPVLVLITDGGYQPSNASRDGAWRRIAVRVLSRPGLEVRHRAGYDAPRGRRFGAR